jgi:hypothetical protein
MLSFKISDRGCSIWVPLLKLRINDVLFWMVTGVRIVFEEFNYCAKDLIIWAFASIEDV